MAAAFVQNLGSASGSGSQSPVVVVPAGGVPIGHRLVLAFASSSGQLITSIADSRGNTWTNATSVSSLSPSVELWSTNVATALLAGDSITTTINTTGSKGLTIEVLEFSGVLTSASGDGTATGTGTTGAPTASVTTTQAGDLIVGATAEITSTATVTEPGGYTAIAKQVGTLGTTPPTLAMAYQVQGAAGSVTYNPTWSASQNVSCAMVAFKAVPVTSSPTRTLVGVGA